MTAVKTTPAVDAGLTETSGTSPVEVPEVVVELQTQTISGIKLKPDPLEVFPGPEILEQPQGLRPPIECIPGFKAVRVPENSVAVYEDLGWRFTYHSDTGRSDAGIVTDEVKYQTAPGGRLMQLGSYIMVMRDDTHARLKQREKQLAQAPIKSMRQSQHGKEGRDPDWFAVSYREEDGVRPAGAIGARGSFVSDDEDEKATA